MANLLWVVYFAGCITGMVVLLCAQATRRWNRRRRLQKKIDEQDERTKETLKDLGYLDQ